MYRPRLACAINAGLSHMRRKVSVRVILHGMPRLIRIYTLRRVRNVGFLVIRLIYSRHNVHKPSAADESKVLFMFWRRNDNLWGIEHFNWDKTQYITLIHIYPDTLTLSEIHSNVVRMNLRVWFRIWPSETVWYCSHLYIYLSLSLHYQVIHISLMAAPFGHGVASKVL